MTTNISSTGPQLSSTPIANMDVGSTAAASEPTEHDSAADGSSQHSSAAYDDNDDGASETSTMAYDHEPFETFRHKVTDLMAKTFGCNRTSICTEHIKGGSFNRVIGLEVQAHLQGRKSCLNWVHKFVGKLFGKPESQAYVVRIPRGDIDDLDCQIATLKTVHDRLPFPTPEVVHYDLSSENVLESNYMVQKRIPGQQVLHLLDTMNLEQKKSVMRQFIVMINQITSIEAAPGNISASKLTTSFLEPISIDKIAASAEGEALSTMKKSVDHLLEVIEMHRQHQIKNEMCFYDIWDGFTTICKSLEARGFLEGPSVLVHDDLQSYNLLAKVTDASSVQITGIIDWDDAFFAPKIMALRAPFWLWTSDEDGNTRDHFLEKPAMVEPANEEGRKLRQMFLDIASEEHQRFAFSPEAMLARRMYHHLRTGLHSAWQAMPAEAIIREWDELHPEDHAKIGESYFEANGTMKKSSWAKVGNYSDSESEAGSDDEDGSDMGEEQDTENNDSV